MREGERKGSRGEGRGGGDFMGGRTGVCPVNHTPEIAAHTVLEDTQGI